MENKKTFGAYILQRRKDLGMTQKEFAEKLYVTESAVSKWERGMSYPDITLLQSICDVLDISEHELLTGSEDTQKRQAENLADKYLRLTRNFCITQYLIYGLTLLGCAIGNLAAQHRLDWFFIVLASVMMTASLTLLPALTARHPRLCHYKSAISLGCFTFSLELLLLICCIYTGGKWFLVAGVAVLFSLALILLPFLLPQLPSAHLTQRKASVCLVVDTFLLILLLLVCCLYTKGSWFFVAAVSVLFGLGFFILPVLLRQAPLPPSLKPHKALWYFGIQTVLLFLLLFLAGRPYGTRTLLHLSLPTALICLILPWGIMAAIRYLPANGWFKASVSCGWSALWLWLAPCIMDLAMSAFYGAPEMHYPLWISFNFTVWNNSQQIGWNVMAIILLSLTALAVIFAFMGLMHWKKHRNSVLTH